MRLYSIFLMSFVTLSYLGAHELEQGTLTDTPPPPYSVNDIRQQNTPLSIPSSNIQNDAALAARILEIDQHIYSGKTSMIPIMVGSTLPIFVAFSMLFYSCLRDEKEQCNKDTSFLMGAGLAMLITNGIIGFEHALKQYKGSQQRRILRESFH